MNQFRNDVRKKALIALGFIFATLVVSAADNVESKNSSALEKELIEIIDYAIPLDVVFQDLKEKKPYWPYSETDVVTMAQIKCMRARFTSVEISAYKRKLIARYLKERGDAVTEDMKALKGGIAEAMRKFYLSIPGGQPEVDNILMSVSTDPDLTELAKVLMIDQEAGAPLGFKRMITYISVQAEMACARN